MHTDSALAHRLESGFDTSQKGYILIQLGQHIAHSHHHFNMGYIRNASRAFWIDGYADKFIQTEVAVMIYAMTMHAVVVYMMISLALT